MLASSLRRAAVLSLLLVGCANTITADAPDAATHDVPSAPDVPTAPDVPSVSVDVPSAPDVPIATPDVPPPPVDAPPGSGCPLSFILAAGARVSHATIEPIDGGFALAWVQADDGTTVARVYNRDFTPIRPVGIPLELPSRGAVPDSLSLSFAGDTGLVAAGSSLHVIARSAGTLTLTNTLDLSPRVARAAWASSPTSFLVIASDTSMIFTNGARMSASTPNAAVDPIGPGASVMSADASGGGYFALEDVGGRLRMRRFITGHGSVIRVNDEAGDGASASRVLSTPSGLYRLVYRGVREVDVALEARDPETLALRALPTVLHDAAAWNATTAALAPAGDGLFMAWASKPASAGYNSSIEAQWGVGGAHTTVFRGGADRELRVFGAAVDATATRAWVIFGEPAAEGGYQLRGQCVAR